MEKSSGKWKIVKVSCMSNYCLNFYQNWFEIWDEWWVLALFHPYLGKNLQEEKQEFLN